MLVAVLIPTFRRPHKVAQITANVRESCDQANVYFVCEREDKETINEVIMTPHANLVVNRRKRCYAGAINSGVAETDEDFVFAGADDLNFHPGWFANALQAMNKPVEVVGTNDLGNQQVLAGEHATHYLVTRNYATQGVIDHLGLMLCEEYDHNWCDTEFIETARARGRFAPCLDAVVEHLHPAWGKAPHDEGYTKSFANEGVDRARFQERRHLWT